MYLTTFKTCFYFFSNNLAFYFFYSIFRYSIWLKFLIFNHFIKNLYNLQTIKTFYKAKKLLTANVNVMTSPILLKKKFNSIIKTFYFYKFFFTYTTLLTTNNISTTAAIFNFNNISYISFFYKINMGLKYINYNVKLLFKKFFNFLNLIFILQNYSYKPMAFGNAYFHSEMLFLNSFNVQKELNLNLSFVNNLFLINFYFNAPFLYFLKKLLIKNNLFAIVVDFTLFSKLSIIFKKLCIPSFSLVPISYNPWTFWYTMPLLKQTFISQIFFFNIFFKLNKFYLNFLYQQHLIYVNNLKVVYL